MKGRPYEAFIVDAAVLELRRAIGLVRKSFRYDADKLIGLTVTLRASAARSPIGGWLNRRFYLREGRALGAVEMIIGTCKNAVRGLVFPEGVVSVAGTAEGMLYRTRTHVKRPTYPRCLCGYMHDT